MQTLEKSLSKLDQELSSLTARLANPAFRDRAPKEIVEGEEVKRSELKEKIEKIRDNLVLLTGRER